MKTPKEYAQHLINRHSLVGLQQREEGFANALITIDEIIKYHNSLFELGLKNVHQTFTTPTEMYNDVMNPAKENLEQVKKEIENLK